MRASLWFEIKYSSNPSKNSAIQNGRNKEADYFSLFNSGNEPSSLEEAKAIAFVLRDHEIVIKETIKKLVNLVEARDFNAYLQTCATYLIAHNEFWGNKPDATKVNLLVGSTTGYLDDDRNNKNLQIPIDDKSLKGTDKDDLVFLQDGDDEFHGGKGNDYIFGEKGADKLYGGDGDDYLYGGDDNDRLEGGEGSDHLFGGVGYDDYYATDGDTIFDSDGLGQVNRQYANNISSLLTGGTREKGAPENTYKNGRFTYVWAKDGDGTLSIYEQGVAGAVTVLNFQNGQLGITLKEQEEENDDRNQAHFDDKTGSNNGWSANVAERRDPLMLDLDHDGLETVGSGEVGAVMFDLSGNGIKSRSGWVKPDDGFLVLDRNGNDMIDDGRELFGDAVIKADGSMAKDGFDALSDLDSNKDGWVNAQDARFNELRVWRDLNSNGISDAGELFTLDALGIAGFDLTRYEQGVVQGNGNSIADTGYYVYSDGSQEVMGSVTHGRMGDLDLSVDTFHSEFSDKIKIAPELQALPGFKGAGRVRDLKEAATLSPALAQALKQFAQTPAVKVEDGQITDLIQKWADTAVDFKTTRQLAAELGEPVAFIFGNDAPTYVSDGNGGGHWQYSESAKAWLKRLDVLEAFWGRTFVGFGPDAKNGTTEVGRASVNGQQVMRVRFNPQQLEAMLDNYQTMERDLFTELAKQAWQVDLLDAATTGDTPQARAQSLAQAVTALLQKDAVGAFIGMALFAQSKAGSNALEKAGIDAWNWVSTYLKNPDYAQAASEAQRQMLKINIFVAGTTGASLRNDRDLVLMRLDGEGSLYGGVKNDILHGGPGRDSLYGGQGSDTYYFERGWGKDYVQDLAVDQGSVDIIRFGQGIAMEDIAVSNSFADGGSLILQSKSSGDSIEVSGFFKDKYYAAFKDDQVQFADGSVWDYNLLRQFALSGTDGNDMLHGFTSNDRLEGGAGNDVLYAGKGDDVLVGGVGNDSLYGDQGSDTYYFEMGWGQDKIFENNPDPGDTNIIRFGQGIDPDEFIVRYSGDYWHALILTNKLSQDNLTIYNYFKSDDIVNTAFEVHFENGEIWDSSILKNKLRQGTDGDDTLYGFAGDDHLQGGEGNDTLYGRGGNDILDGGAGDDTITGGSGDNYFIGGSGNDRMEGGAGHNTFYFEQGWGQDTIDAFWGKNNTLVFGENIHAGDIMVSRNKTDIIVKLKGSADQITLNNIFSPNARDSGEYQGTLESLRFADGTIWHGDEIIQLLSKPTDGNDTFYGTFASDTLRSGAGNDILYAEDGDDYLEGGIGNDWLDGGRGSDVYYFDQGWGQDRIEERYRYATDQNVIRFGGGIKASDMVVRYVQTRDQNERYLVPALRIASKSTDDYIDVLGYFKEGTWAKPDVAIESDCLYEVRFADGTVWKAEDIAQLLMTATDGNDELRLFGSDHDNLYGEGGNDELVGNSGNNKIYGGQGNDYLYGFAGNDVLEGGAGDDYIRGGVGDDMIIGGAGNDILDGEEGNDIYYFERGWGKDQIRNQDTQGFDVIRFGDGITANDLQFSGFENSVIIRLKNTYDEITVYKFLDEWVDPLSHIKEIQFADGITWNAQDIRAHLMWQAGYGDDTLLGTAGNDILRGGGGSDIYVFQASGWGQDIIDNLDNDRGKKDVIRFGTGISAADIQMTKVSSDLVLKRKNRTDTITVQNYFNFTDAEHKYQVEEIQFADGTIWDFQTIWRQFMAIKATTGADTLFGTVRSDVIHGLAGNDTIYGGAGDDALYGDAGNDILYGGAGNDTYYFEKNWGQDTVYDAIDSASGSTIEGNAGSYDAIVFGAGITQANIVASRTGDSGQNLVLTYKGSRNKVTITGYFEQEHRIETIRFADGSSWSYDEIVKQVSQGTNAADTIYGGAYSDDTLYGGAGKDKLYGLAGNDLLYGEDGADTLDGGDGHDKLYGGADNDILLGGNGNDWLEGQEGNDQLNGGAGSDRYIFNQGWGQDTGVDNDATEGNTDSFLFGDGIRSDQLWFRKVGSNLEVSRIGTSDKVTITSWYSGNNNHIEEFQAGDRKVMNHASIDKLVSAMAAFAPPASGQTSLTEQQQQALAPVLAASWQ